MYKTNRFHLVNDFGQSFPLVNAPVMCRECQTDERETQRYR